MNATETITRHIETIRISKAIPYREAYRLQRMRRTAVEKGERGNALFLLEHEPVITLGRNACPENLLHTRDELREMGIDLQEADRGGDITYHGPGQLVAYPILNLRLWRPSIRWYLRSLEEILVRTLADYGLHGQRIKGLTGVWVDGAKIAAIGIGIHNWVTFHGISLNVKPNMAHFDLIVPCGIPDKAVTSLAQFLDTAPTMKTAMDTFQKCFLNYFATYKDCAKAHERETGESTLS